MKGDDNHFSYEKQGILTTDSQLLFVYCVLFALVISNCKQFENTFGTRNTPHLYCMIAMGLQCFAIICDLIHNWNYSIDGVGIVVFDVFGTVFDMLSECVMTLVVLMLANGWYTRFKTYDIDDGLEVYAPLFLLVIMVHILFGALSYID